MKSYRILSTSFGLILGITAAVFAGIHRTGSIFSATAAQQPVSNGGTGADIPSPSYWVPFVAKVRTVSEVGGSRRVGMEGVFYRGQDGSDRFESGPENGPIKIITIHNIAAVRYYVFKEGRWTSYPMSLPSDGYRPRKRRVDMNGMEEFSETMLGYRVYKYTDMGGVVSHVTPDLNFFSLRTSHSGTVQEFYDVQLGDQPQHLFFPPAGVDIEERAELKGIISTPNPRKR